MARIEKSIEVHVPLHTAYNQWTQFEEFPKFMESVHEVKQTDDTHLHWRAELGGKQLEWDAEIFDQVPDKHIAWRSTGGVKNAGEVSFQPVGEDRTRINFVLDVATPGGKNAGGEELSTRTEADLKRFKEFIEKRVQESGAWRGEVHQGQAPQGQAHQGQAQIAAKSASVSALQSAQQSIQQSVQQSVQEAGQSMNQVSAAVQQSFRDAGRQAARTQADWQSTTNAAASAALRPFNSVLALGSGPWFSSFFNAFEQPLNVMRRFSEELDREFESVMRRTIRATGGDAAASSLAWAPSVDVERHEDKVLVHADLPGIRKEDVQIEVQGGRLIITGERRQQSRSSNGGVQRTECSYGRFQRAIPLPDDVDIEGARATIDNGVLEVSLPASRQAGSRRIEIQTAESGQQRPPQGQATQSTGARAH